MASGAHALQQQRPQLEKGIRALVNDGLKKICRAYGYQVSGPKAVLVTRCIEILDNALTDGDVTVVEELRYRLNHQGRDPPPGVLHDNNSNYPSAQGYSMSSQRGGQGLPASSQPPHRRYFKQSPFYEPLETLVTLQDLPEAYPTDSDMPEHRNTVKAYLTLRQDLAQQFRSDNSLKIILLCGHAHGMGPYSLVDISFPSQIEVKINGEDVKANFKGLKNKPGTTKPADITTYVRKYNGQLNTIQVTYALTKTRYAFTVLLARHSNVDRLVSRIKKQNVIRKQTVLNTMRRVNADSDITATSVRMSLKDPISTLRITLPVRSSHCTHNQCFDGAMFLQLQEQAPQWLCPVCSKAIPFDSLCVDEYFQEILDTTTASTEKVDIEPDGKWKVIKEDDDDDEGQGGGKKRRADYDSDFDDDLVEVEQPGLKQVNGVKRESMSQTGPNKRPAVLDTPPLSSREASVAQSASSAQRSNKRPQSAVIDLTLSDDEEEQPVRPAKRPNTNSQPANGRLSNAYNTPSSLPDSRNQTNIPQRQRSGISLSLPRPAESSCRPGNSSNGNQYQTNISNTSMSPPATNSPHTFGQPSVPSQHSRQLPSPVPPSNTAFTNPDSNRTYSPYSASNSATSLFPPGSPFAARPGSQQSYHQYRHPSEQQHNSSSPAPAPSSRTGGEVNLPSMPPPPPQQPNQFSGQQDHQQYSSYQFPTQQQQQQQQYNSRSSDFDNAFPDAFPSPQPYQNDNQNGWRSEGSEYGYQWHGGSPGA